MGLHESGENYLETILMLYNKNGSVRSIDIANELEFTKPSVSRAMSILKSQKLITVEQNGNIHLTEEGLKRAEQIYDRHKIITLYLIEKLGVSSSTAEEDACRIEHIISEEAFEKMKHQLK